MRTMTCLSAGITFPVIRLYYLQVVYWWTRMLLSYPVYEDHVGYTEIVQYQENAKLDQLNSPYHQ